MITKIVIKIVVAILFIGAGFYGSAYLFNHVNPWLAIACGIIGVGAAVIIAANILKSYFSNQNKNDK